MSRSSTASVASSTTLSNGSDDAPTGVGGAGSGKPDRRPMMHIEDVTGAKADIDPLAPVDKILSYADQCMKQAETYKSFGRPDYALQQYIMAYDTITNVVPRSKGWVSLKTENKTGRARYNNLLAKIQQNYSAFDEIKEAIKKDNARTGVRSQSHRQPPPQTPRVNGQANGAGSVAHSDSVTTKTPTASLDRSIAASSSPKARPVVQPKPPSLHGNAIKPMVGTGAASNNGPQDLSERFANLRGPPVQAGGANSANLRGGDGVRGRDTGRVNGHGTRPSVSLAHAIPELPKVPEAIYSPARGTVSNQAAQLPSSTPRGMFSRTGSTTSLSNPIKPSTTGDGYFPASAEGSPVRPRLSLPDGQSITVQELLGFMKAGADAVRILLIDVRNREEFDEGHIMSQSTICIEPDVLQRDSISANDIFESMVLAPSAEADLFEKRHQFDLVVYYDQASERIHSQGTDENNALLGLWNALVHFDYAGPRSTKPKVRLLKGGVEAWTSVMGAGSLQSSTTTSAKPRTASRTDVPRSPALRRSTTTKWFTRPIQDADEAMRWENSLADADGSMLLRTTEDFLRRYPPVVTTQESMTSPVARDAAPTRFSFTSTRSVDPDPFPSLPAPPTRPPPTVPRPSHSGLTETEDEHNIMPSKTTTLKEPEGFHMMGLYNPGNWCYANSSFQCIFRTGLFVEELNPQLFMHNWPVPMKKDETLKQPQLMSKMLANLFHWMASGKMQSMKATTIMKYCLSLHSRDIHGQIVTGNSLFGGSDQQDASEFISYLSGHVHDETNRKRDKVGELKHSDYPYPGDGRVTKQAVEFWDAYSQLNDSLIDKYWRGVDASFHNCRECTHTTISYNTFDALNLAFPDHDVSSTTLEDLLKAYTQPELLEGYRCDKCAAVSTTTKQTLLVRLPDVLCVCFSRFKMNRSDARKINAPVSFPISALNMTQWTVQGVIEQQNDPARGSLQHQYRDPFVYDCQSVIVHGGTLKGGHYRAYVRDDNDAVSGSNPGAWHLFNDDRITACRIGTNERGDATQKMYSETPTTNAYVVFYHRRDIVATP